jgi:hypothetical protein
MYFYLSKLPGFMGSSRIIVSQDGLKLLKPQISQQHPSRIAFITPDWNVPYELNLLPLTMRMYIGCIHLTQTMVIT